MNNGSQIYLEEHGNVHELSTELRHQTLSFNTDFGCQDSQLTIQSFSHQGKKMSHTSPLNTIDETACILPSFQSTFIKTISLNVISSASNNESYQVPNQSEDCQSVNQAVSIDNEAQQSIGPIHNYNELIDVSNNIEPAKLIELSEMSQQKEPPVNVSSTHQLEEEVETKKKTFLSTSGIAIESPLSDALELEVQSISRTRENICSDCGNAFTPTAQMDQHNVVLAGGICKRKVINQSSSNKTMIPHTEDAISVSGPSHSQLFISKKKRKSLFKNSILLRNQLIQERNTSTNNAPKVAFSSGTQHHKPANLFHKSSLKKRPRANSNFRTSRDMPGNISTEDLESELASSSKKKMHISQECGKDFISKSSLKRHSVVHTGDKPFVCHICKNAYSRKDHLKRHVRAKHPETSVMPRANPNFRTSIDMPGNSSCEYLETEVASSSELKRHICQECGKPFVCDICECQFSQKANLNVHKRNYHPETFQMCGLFKNILPSDQFEKPLSNAHK